MGNWWCTRCQSYKDSWAEHQGYKSNETYRRDIKCYSCDSSNLIYTDSQKSRYKELIKERTSISGHIEEVERFSTWWSNNIATAIYCYEGCYRVALLVYDPVYSTYKPAVFPDAYNSCKHWGERSRGFHNYLSDARSEASWLRGELVSSYGKYSDNPILLIHPYCDCYRSFEDFVKEPYVTKNYSTSYLKPFDVVKTDMKIFDHVGVYLGKIDEDFKVCHYTMEKKDTTIDQWSDFLVGKVSAYHPIIPFKNYKDIAKQIVWAKDNHFRKNNYDTPSRNCEHFANMVVYGINYSEQIENKKGRLGASVGIIGGATTGTMAGLGTYNIIGSILLAPATGGVSLLWGAVSTGVAGVGIATAVEACEEFGGSGKANNDKGSTIKLTNEISESYSKLGKKSDWESEKYENKYLQEIPPKENCRVM